MNTSEKICRESIEVYGYLREEVVCDDDSLNIKIFLALWPKQISCL